MMGICRYLNLLVLAAAIFVGVAAAANAEDMATLVRRCDAAASSAADPDRPPGFDDVPFASVDPDVAVPACEAAAKVAPNNRRIAFQLGRSYDAVTRGHGPKGPAQYRKAAELGGAMGQYALCIGDWDSAETLEWCRRAAAAGIVAAMGEYAWLNIKMNSSENDHFLIALKEIARSGDPAAKENLVWMYKDDCYAVKNLAESARWQAAKFASTTPSAVGSVPSRRLVFRFLGGACF